MTPFDLPRKLWFRCEKDQMVYRSIRRLGMCTTADILEDLGHDRGDSSYIQTGLRNLKQMELIHIVGHFGGNNRAVYALLYKE